MSDQVSLEEYLAGGGKLSSPANANARYRGEVMRLMAGFVDSEMAGASGFADCINMAPGLKERQIAARIVLEKFGHAQRVLKLMHEFGANTTRYVQHHPWARRMARDVDLGSRRADGDMRLNVFHYPIQDWCDAVAMNTLMGRATVIQLDELARCSYQPLADVMTGVLPAETQHADLGEAGLRQLLLDGHDQSTAQESVDYWYPRVAATFGRIASERFEVCRRYGLRQHRNEALLALWRRDTFDRLTRLGLCTPGAVSD